MSAFSSVLVALLALVCFEAYGSGTKNYSVQLHIVVAEEDKARASSLKLAAQSGGYFSKVSNEKIILMIRASGLEKYLEEMEELGEITTKDIQSVDLTSEQMLMNRMLL